MSETYTIGGDTLHFFERLKVAGQTFTPEIDHTLEWIDLNLRLSGFLPEPVILVYNAAPDHTPYGDYLSRNKWMDYPYRLTLVTKRVRFPMTPVLLYKGQDYCITARAYPGLGQSGHWWQYDKGDATYPGGLRISSVDAGETWTIHPNDDHIFAEFGTPPAPKPPPEPPIDKVAPLSIEQHLTPDGYRIILATNVPSHLFCHWTSLTPHKHLTPIYRRGLWLKDAVRFCFVAWYSQEQEEPGDTLYHTFILEPWATCQTRWLTFKAKVDEQWSASATPIFTKHRGEYVPSFTIILTEPWSEYMVPPVFSLILTEPWSQYMAPPVFSLILIEPWTQYIAPPVFTIILTEPWTGETEPPPMSLILTEPWSGWLTPPPMTLILTEPWTGWFTPPPMSLILTEPWTHYVTPPPPFTEPWGDTLTENNPWEYNIPLGGIDYELYDSLIRLYNPAMDGCGIKCPFAPNEIPLVNPFAEHLYFKAISTEPEPTTHDAYIPAFIYTTNGVDSYLIEMIITRGDFWGPWPDLIWAGANTAGKDYGLDPGPIDIAAFWMWARNEAGLPANPSGWYIDNIALIFEAVEYELNPYLINDFIGLTYQ